MKKSTLLTISILIVLFGMLIAVRDVAALDAPHNANDVSRSITCSTCHVSPLGPTPTWKTIPTTTDNTYTNNLCTSCHASGKLTTSKYEDIKTHSAANTGSTRWGGGWTVECRVCHHAHNQAQQTTFYSDANNNVLTGTVAALTSSVSATMSTLTASAGSMGTDGYVGYLLIPNTAYPTIMYRVIANDATKFTVKGAINLARTAVGKTWALRYGKMVKTQIAYTNPTSVNASVKFYNNAGNNSFAETASPSTSLCMVCHTQTKHFKNDGTFETAGHPAAVGTACTSCHKHNTGFKASGCNGCHGQSGSTGAPLVAGDLVSPATGHAEGAHLRHAVTLSLSCAVCHAGNTMPALDSEITMSFSDAAAGGAYQGTALNAPYTYSANVTLGGTQTCSSLYCHSSGQSATGGSLAGGDYKSVNWTGAGLNCGSCHVDMDASASATGSHIKHAQDKAIACATCHDGYTETSTAAATHANASINLSFSGRAAGSTYSQGNSHAVQNGYGQCSTNDCHSTGQGSDGSSSGITYASPTWGGTVNCSSCHKNMDADATAPGSHVKHAQSAAIACATCHNGYTETTAAVATHDDGTVDMSFSGPGDGTFYTGGTTSGNYALGGGYGSCYTSSCHSSGQSATGTASPLTYGSPAWGGTLDCGSCHKNMDTDATAPGSHVKHTQSAAIACATCHNGYTETSVAAASHNNGTVDMSFSGTGAGTFYSGGTVSGDNALGGGYGSCYTSSCHSSGQSATGTASPLTYGSPAWGGALDCGSCHKNMDTDGTAPGSHVGHAQTAAIACATCHSGYTETTVAAATHNNSTVNVTMSTGFYSGGTVSGDNALGGGYGTCFTTNCHGSSSPVWGTNTTNASCTKCHGVSGATPAQYTADNNIAAPGYVSVAPVGTGRATSGATAATDPKVGAHNAHLKGVSNYSDPIACSACHNTSSGHMDGSGTLTFSGLSTSNGAAANYSAPNCSTTYCHFGKSINLYSPAVSSATVTWNDTAYLSGTPSIGGDCAKCHLSPPSATGTHAGYSTFTDCNTCHPHVSTDGTFNNKSLHINGVVEAASGCDGCHAYPPAIGDGKAYKGSALLGKGAHTSHVNYLLLRTGLTLSAKGDTYTGATVAAICGVCHNTSADAFHKNGNDVRDLLIPSSYLFGTGTPTYNGNPATTTNKNCSNVSCHFNVTPLWQQTAGQ